MLSCFAADYRTAGFELLERLATVTPEFVADVVRQQVGLDGAVLLTTCNRFEAYLDVTDAQARDAAAGALLTAVAQQTGVGTGEVTPVLRTFDDADAAAHLFAVSSGLESVVLGEGEIGGQVGRALEVARIARTTTPGLEQVFQRAAHTSNQVQFRTRIGGKGRSMVRLALDLVESRITDWSEAGVLLIGTGSYAGATLAALRGRGVRAVSVFSPSGRAARFAGREGVVPVERDALPGVLGRADLVIACSVASVPVLDAAALTAARESVGRTRPQMVIDLGLPRNICPDVGGVVGVELLDLETISLHAPLPDFAATEDARAMVDAAVDEYRAAQQATAVTPAVVAFRTHVFTLVDDELERLRRRGESTEAAERALRHLASVLVHTPSARARELAAEGEGPTFVAALQTIYGLGLDAGLDVGIDAPGPVPSAGPRPVSRSLVDDGPADETVSC
ncbi:glutamyl-tRNA reductase [uncultured Amnibacterium sp.]|uniref:glutamyl-tRNA reductase n=1 Tax=uncultured Amnibacterium sp. TaxID=1631851 RepID=UPI0035CBDA06